MAGKYRSAVICRNQALIPPTFYWLPNAITRPQHCLCKLPPPSPPQEQLIVVTDGTAALGEIWPCVGMNERGAFTRGVSFVDLVKASKSYLIAGKTQNTLFSEARKNSSVLNFTCMLPLEVLIVKLVIRTLLEIYAKSYVFDNWVLCLL